MICIADPAPEPRLGIFWFLRDDSGVLHVLSHGCALCDAEEYGDCLTYPNSHIAVWAAWRKGRLAQHPPSVRIILAHTEYEEWPRGRIVFDRSRDRFVVYADRQLLPYAADIQKTFHLPPDRTDVDTDLHYRNARRITPASRRHP